MNSEPRLYRPCGNFAVEPPGPLPQSRSGDCRWGFPRSTDCFPGGAWNADRLSNGWSPSKGGGPPAWPCRGFERHCSSGPSGLSSIPPRNFIPLPCRDGESRSIRCSSCDQAASQTLPGRWSNACDVWPWDSPGSSRKRPFPTGSCNVGRSPPKRGEGWEF